MKRKVEKIKQVLLGGLIMAGAVLAMPITACADVAITPSEEMLTGTPFIGILVVIEMAILILCVGIHLIIVGIRESREASMDEGTEIKEGESSDTCERCEQTNEHGETDSDNQN